MEQENKIRVAVLYGGRSAEHEVSLRSAANVMQFLDKSLFDIVPIGIDKQGKWFMGEEVFAKSLEHDHIPKLNQFQTWFTPEWLSTSVIEKKSVPAFKPNGALFDVVFPAVHGTFCEDGTLQGLLELAELPYVGSGVLSSAVGMDKDVSKRLVQAEGICVTPYIVIRHEQWALHPDRYLTLVKDKLGFPVFVKPVNAGSSIGISKVKSADQLSDAIQEALRFDTKIIVEKALNVVELELSVLEALEPGADPIVSVVGEIKPEEKHEFYSYEAKYQDENGAELIIPAPISDELSRQARDIAKRIFLTLECEGMARVDLFLDKDSQEIVFNEINTLPGFTQISMYPKLMQASGMSYPALLTHLVKLAIKRHKHKQALIRSYK